MAKHKVARKVASNSREYNPNRQPPIVLRDWLEESHPEVFKQYLAIKDLEQSVDDDIDYRYQKAINQAFMDSYKYFKGK